MKYRLYVFAALCLSVLTMAQPGFSQVQEVKPEPELVLQMLQEGWQKVAEGVLQRSVDGQTETFTYGEDGLRWTARRLEARLEVLQKEYAVNPSEKLADIIESLITQLIENDQVADSGAAQEPVVTLEEIANCTISYWATAAADPLTGSQAPGVTANATAYFHANCGQIGNSYAYAYARATAGTVTTTKTQEDPKYNSSWVDSAAAASASGTLDCYSEAYGRTWSPQLNISYEVSDTNYSCPNAPPVLNVSISGPTDVWTDDYTPCQSVTWTANVSGGTPAYTYKWYLGTSTTVVGTGSSYSRNYCRTNGRVDVKVVVTDSGSPAQTAQDTHSTWFYYEQSCTSGCNCPLQDPNSSSVNAMPPVTYCQ